MTRVISTAGNMGKPPSVMRRAATIPVIPMTEPTERSMPAVRMTQVMPTAEMPSIATCRATVRRFPAVRNERLTTEKNTISANSTPRIAYFFRDAILLII